jgi:23S rRNA pseudouridine1911/1915/1917 synthase
VETFSVDEADAGLRLDVLLARRAGWSRRSAQQAIAAGAVCLNGHRVRKAQTVASGDSVAIDPTQMQPPALQPNESLNLRVLYEDEHLIAVNKPAGVPSHALRADETHTVANFLLTRTPGIAAVIANHLEAGLVHRLDTDTSGVLLAARTAAAYEHLRAQFRERAVVKEYLAIVEGDVAMPGEVRTPLTHDRRDRRKMRVATSDDSQARPALTHYRPLERFPAHTLLAVYIETGVMHQIRVHLAALGHPIVGDGLYGSSTVAPRQLLHAAKLIFSHPVSGERIELHSRPPRDFEAHLGALRKSGRATPGRFRKTRFRS